MIDRFNRRLSKIFGPYKRIDRVMELRDEMLGTLMDKYDKFRSQGMGEEESYNKSLDTLIGIEKTILAIERESIQPAPEGVINKYILPSLAYWLTLIVAYLGVSLSTRRWDVTWMIVVDGALLFGAVVGLVMFRISKEKGMRLLSRSNLLIASMLITTTIYLAWSFASGKWQYTWVIFLVGIMVAYIIDMVIQSGKGKFIIKPLDAIILTVLTAIVVYILTSFLTGAWATTWIIFVVMALGVIVELMIFNKKSTR